MEQALKIAVVLAATDRMTRVVEGAVRNSTKHLDRFSKSARVADSMASLGAKATVAGAAMTTYFASTVQAALESEAATNKLNNVFKTMGDTTGVAAQKAAEYASTLQMTIGIEDEQIMAVQAKLATFKKASDTYAIQSGMFNRLTAAAFDLEALGFGDAMSNITQLGKAFQDPVKGATALKRSGTLTAAEVEKVGNIAKRQGVRAAQEFMVQAIERQAKGAAAATANPLKQLAIQYSEVSESIGKSLLPALKSFSEWLSKIMPKLQGWIENNPVLVKAIAAIGASLVILGPILMAASAAVTVFNAALWANPITWIVMAVVALIASIVILIAKWEQITEWFKKSSTAMKILLTPLIIANAGIIAIAYSVRKVIDNWGKIEKFFDDLWENIKNIFISTWEWIKNLFLNYHPYGLIIKHWDAIVAFFADIWTKVKAKFWEWVTWVQGLGTEFYNAGVNIVDSIWRGIKDMAHKPIDAIKDIVTDIRAHLPFSPAKKGPLRDIHRIRLVETIAEGVKPAALNNKVTGVLKSTRQTINNVLDINRPGAFGNMLMPKMASSPVAAMAGIGGNRTSSSNVVVNFSPTINNSGAPGEKQNFVSQLKEYEGELMRMIKDATSRQERKLF